MKISYNEVVETLAPAIADKFNKRAVMKCVNGEIMLIDFSYGDSEAPFTNGIVCLWSLQRDIMRGEIYCGTEEVDAGIFNSYMDVFAFIFGQAMVQGTELYVESF